MCSNVFVEILSLINEGGRLSREAGQSQIERWVMPGGRWSREKLFSVAMPRDLRVGGRYQNPFDEHREEGAWEWCVWLPAQALSVGA